MRTRHSITMDEETWRILNEMKSVLGRSASSIIEEAVKEFLERHKHESLKLMLLATVPPVSEEESEQISKDLKEISPEDLEVGEVEEL